MNEARLAIARTLETIAHAGLEHRTREWAELHARALIDEFCPIGLAPRTVDYSGLVAPLNTIPYTNPDHHGRLVSSLGQALELQAQIFEDQTLYEHTARVVAQYLRYLEPVPVPVPFTKIGIVTALVLHDCGKSLGSKVHQHDQTLVLIDEAFNGKLLPVADEEFKVVRALIKGDPLGRLVRASCLSAPSFEFKKSLYTAGLDQHAKRAALREHILGQATYVDLSTVPEHGRGEFERAFTLAESAAQELAAKARETGMSPDAFFDTQLLYYQADTLAYSSDSYFDGKLGAVSLEGLYELNLDDTERLFLTFGERSRVRFIPAIEGTLRFVRERTVEIASR